MVTWQADPGFDLPETETVDERADPGHDGYTELLNALVTETKAFPGQVVLVHGDTHFFKLDKPLINQANLLPNFTRLETFGSPNVDWVRVQVDPNSRNLPVRAHGRRRQPPMTHPRMGAAALLHHRSPLRPGPALDAGPGRHGPPRASSAT
jgi:hypothetical protein